MDFDRNGDCFLACCVIPHLFHMVPGGNYIRQGGTSFNPYAYGQLKEICDHTHHKESGWAHAGLIVLEGETIPADLRGSLLMGSIHGCSVKHDNLRPNGSTYIGTHAPDFLVSGDKNFRPINMRWGPDGSIYLIDWHDQNPCHQADPGSWDMTHGRIYKIQRTGAKPQPAIDLAKLTNEELIGLLTKDNPYYYRTALRLLNERKGEGHTRVDGQATKNTESLPPYEGGAMGGRMHPSSFSKTSCSTTPTPLMPCAVFGAFMQSAPWMKRPLARPSNMRVHTFALGPSVSWVSRSK